MAATTTASQIIDEVLEKLSEVPASPVYWSRAEILEFVWEGLVELNLFSGFLQKPVTLTLANNPVQQSPAHIAVLHVRVNNKAMLKYSVDELDAQFPVWENELQVLRPQRWAPIGLNYFLTYKRTSTANVPAVVDVLELPAVLTESAVIPLDDEFTNCLVEYGFSMARLKEGGAEFEQGLASYKDFIEVAQDLASRWNWKRMPGWTVEPKTKLADSVPRRNG